MLFLLALLCLVARDWVIDIKRNMLPIFLLLAVVLVLTILRPAGADLQSTAIRYANFIGGILLLDLYLRAGAGALMRDLYVLGRLMAWQALITMVLARFFNFLFLPVEISGTLYSTIAGIFNYHVMVDDSALRPDGLFYEPGVFQIYLNVFLYLTLFVFKRWKEAVVALLAVVSTQSTTGIIIASMLTGWFVATRYINRGSVPVRVAKFFVAAAMVGALALVTYSNINDKLSGDSQGSFWARQYDLITGLNIIAEHPLAGIGFDYDQYYHASGELGQADTQLPDRITQDRANSNGIIFLLYSIGIPLSIPFLFGMFRQTLFPDRLLMGAVIFLACTGESLVFTPFFLMFIFSGLLMKIPAARAAAVVPG